jgi:uncharacterized OsmC-like protein
VERAADTRSVLIRHHRAGSAELDFETPTGGHLLHLALAGCVFNNVIRLSADRGIELTDASVRVGGGFTSDGESTGIHVDISMVAAANGAQVTALRREAFENSTVVYVLRKATSVELID